MGKSWWFIVSVLHCLFCINKVISGKRQFYFTTSHHLLSIVPAPARGWWLLQVWWGARLPGFHQCPASAHFGKHPTGRPVWSRRCRRGATFHHGPPKAAGQPTAITHCRLYHQPQQLRRFKRRTHLVVYEQLYWVIAPFNQHNLIRLAGHPIRERCPNARACTGLNPHAESEGVHLRQGLSEAAIQVVGPLGEGQFKLLWGLEVSSTCNQRESRGV